MHTNEGLFKNYCPLVEEFHIKNIVGAKERKQSIFGGRVTPAGATTAVTFSTLSGGIITALDHSRILVQELNTSPGACSVAAKAAQGFTLYGDVGQTYSIIVLGTEPAHPKSTAKWAKDYCPFCKSQGFDGIIGEVLSDQVLFTFSHKLAAGSDAITFRSQTIQSITGIAKGQMAGPLVSLMSDALYQIAIQKSDDVTSISALPYPSSINKAGFTLNGDSGQTYDVFVLGSIQN